MGPETHEIMKKAKECCVVVEVMGKLIIYFKRVERGFMRHGGVEERESIMTTQLFHIQKTSA